MQCDKCCKIVSEDDTHERVLCRKCNKNEKNPPKMHCVKCACLVKWKNALTAVMTLSKKYKIPLAIFSSIVLLLLIVGCGMHSQIVQKFLIGVIAIPTIGIALTITFFVIFYSVYKLGFFVLQCVFKCEKHEIPNFDDTPAGVFTWLFGALLLASPFLLYWLGIWAMYIVHLFL